MSDSKLERARKELTRKVMGRPGVTGTAVGLKNGNPCLKVFVDDPPPKIRRGIPDRIGGFPVVIENSGAFRPF